MRTKPAMICFAFLTTLLTASIVHAGTLENLERERAMTIRTLMEPELDAEQRAARVETARRRLVDLERMVMRDRSLRGVDTPIVQKAFADYDLTFLVHASIEREQSLPEHWLRELGISTESLLAARVGRR